MQRTREIRINDASQAIIAKAGKALVEKKKREFREGNTKSRDVLSLLGGFRSPFEDKAFWFIHSSSSVEYGPGRPFLSKDIRYRYS